MHSSLKSLGWVPGGAVAVVQAFLDALGETGTLVVPDHSGDNSDPAHWENPPVPEEWWDEIRAAIPAYDPATTPSCGIGVLPEAVRTWPGALRSAHPQTSFAARTPQGRQWTTVRDTSITSERFDELGADFERDKEVVRGTVGAAACRLFPVRDAVAYAERWLPVHRPREE